MKYTPLDAADRELIDAAADVIRRNYTPPRHVVGAAVRAASGRIYTGVNIETCGYGPCAEPVAIGGAVSQGERVFTTIVAVGGWDKRMPVIPPCGNCRQLLFDYAPDAWVILEVDGSPVKVLARELLPEAFQLFD
jgi:cytidine deaminase